MTANLPGYDGPFVVDVPAFGTTDRDILLARKRAMYSLMSAGHFDPAPGQSPTDALALFPGELI